MREGPEHQRLGRSFHQTFKPERQYLHAVLHFAAAGGQGDIQNIAAATGIPTGTSSGKVQPTLDYSRGMGLIALADGTTSSVKRPELTPFGRVVLLEDPYLRLPITQWLAHLNLCSPLSGADVWFQTFFVGAEALGKSFTRSDLERHLSLVYGVDTSKAIGPMLGAYQDEASLGTCGALTEDGDVIRKKPAPVSEGMARGYGAWLLALLASHFPKQHQVPVTELDRAAGCWSIPSWDLFQRQRVLDLVARKGLITVDRQMEPWLVAPAADVLQAWKNIYEDLL
jgi:hypothetical protein